MNWKGFKKMVTKRADGSFHCGSCNLVVYVAMGEHYWDVHRPELKEALLPDGVTWQGHFKW